MTSVKEIAATCGVSEKTIRSFCAKNGFRKVRNLWEPSEAERKQIYSYYGAEGAKGSHLPHPSEPSSGTFGSTPEAIFEVIKELRRQLEVKDEQIRELNKALINAQEQGQAAQLLHAADRKDDLILESAEQKKSRWQRLKAAWRD